jgi:Uma2 family endonuclease
MAVATQRMTYVDYLKSPEINARFDIIDGELVMAPAPDIAHQRISKRLFYALDRHVEEKRLGEVLFAPLDVIIRRDPLRTRQPDLLFVSFERSGGGPMAGRSSVEVAPDLVVEILSPANTRQGVEEKLADYAGIGVREAWLVSPDAQTVEVLRLSGEKIERIGLYGVGDRVRSEALKGLNLKVDEIFV